MAFKILLKRFKSYKAKRAGVKEIMNRAEKQRIWTGVSHGVHTVEREIKADDSSVHAQREQLEGQEFWLFGAFDQQLGSGITQYLQSNLFDNNLSEHQIGRRAKETMRKAYLCTKTENSIAGFTAALVVNGERFVAASVGGHRAVLCRDGMAMQLGTKNQRKANGKWAVSDMWSMQCTSANGEDSPQRSSRLALSAHKVDAETEFIILASDGVWEVMRSQEAVDLVSHIEDAQKAAECLAEEALNRMSKSTISCIVIRFH